MNLDRIEIYNAIKEGGLKREQALHAVYSDKSLRARLLSFLLKKGCQMEDALDIYQDTIIIFDQKVRENEVDPKTKIASYLIGVAKYTWLNFHRSRKKNAPLDESQISDQTIENDVEALLLNQDLCAYLDDLLDMLSEQSRKLLLLYANGFKINEIAEMLGFESSRACTKAKYRSIQTLKNELKQNPELYHSIKKLLESDGKY